MGTGDILGVIESSKSGEGCTTLYIYPKKSLNRVHLKEIIYVYKYMAKIQPFLASYPGFPSGDTLLEAAAQDQKGKVS